MAVFRIEKTRDYTVMANHHLRNTALSLKAKGLLSLMLSLPENWDYTTKGLARICKDGVDSIIIKSGEALEKMGKVNTIAFDKTGTLTYGKLECSDIVSMTSDLDKTALLALVASAEARSEHPLGKAIVAHAKEQGITFIEPNDFRMEAGKGIYARVNEQDLLCGSEKYLHENGVNITPSVSQTVNRLREQGKASILAAADGVCVGVIALSDVLRPDAKQMVTGLKKMNTAAVLLTGDNKKTADYFAEKVGITEVCAELLPEEKVGRIEAIQNAGKKVCMIGDGVNDAPALKIASVPLR